jgi:hypothetical protein
VGEDQLTPPLPPGFVAAPPLPPGFVPVEVTPTGAGAIPGGEAPRAPQAPDTRSTLRRILDEVHGAVQTVGAVAANLPVSLAGMGVEAVKGPQASKAFMERYGVTPSSPEAQRNLEAVGDVANQFPAVMPAVGPAGGVAAGLSRPGVARSVEVVRAGAKELKDATGAALDTPVPGVKQAPKGFSSPPATDTNAKLMLPRMKSVVAAQDAGYRLTPKGAEAGATSKMLAKAAGNPQLAKEISAHNAENTARLARKDIGVADDVPLDHEVTRTVREEEGGRYAALKDVGRFQHDSQFMGDLKSISAEIEKAGKDYPSLLESPLLKKVQELRNPEVHTASAVEIVKDLRNESDKAFRLGDAKLGGAYRAAAAAVDNSMERALVKRAEARGADPALQQLVDDYRAARVRIAKTYLLDDALRGKPGEVDATVYGRVHEKNPNRLTGEARQIAEFAKNFREEGVAQKLGRSETKGFGFGDIALGALHGLKGAAIVVARPAARAFLGSDTGQRLVGRRARKAVAAAEEEVPPGPPPLSLEQRPQPLPEPPTVDSRLAEAMRLRAEAKSDVVRKAIDAHIARVQKEIDTERKADAQRAAAAELDTAAQETTDPALRALLEERAAKLRGEEKIPVGEVIEGQPEIKVDVPEKIPVGKVTEGQPEIKVDAPKKIPAGEATEVPPATGRAPEIEPLPVGEAKPGRLQDLPPEEGLTPAVPMGEARELYVDPARFDTGDAAWRKEFGVGDEDAVVAAKLRAAFDVDPVAVDKLIVEHGDRPSIAFDEAVDRLVALLKPKEKKDAPQTKPVAESGKGTATAEPSVQAATDKPGSDSDPAPVTGKDSPLVSGKDGARKRLSVAQYEDGWVVEDETLTEVAGPFKTRSEADRARAAAIASAPDALFDIGSFPAIDASLLAEQTVRAPVKAKGTEGVRKLLEKGKADGSLDADGVDLALWVLDRNPSVASNLTAVIGDLHPEGAKGSYRPMQRVLTLFRSNDTDTAVHEIMHHVERMMPPEVQTGVRKEWKRALEAARVTATKAEREALADVERALTVAAENDDHVAAKTRLIRAFESKVLDKDKFYQLVDPSEFFAVNASRILHDRFAGRGTWRAKAVAWLRDFWQHARSVVGLRSDSPVLKALDEILNPEKTAGERAPRMLAGEEAVERFTQRK